jgi:dTDP-glucose 4,6-dehydratase
LKILVTGGAGFIGSNFIRYFLSSHPQDSVLNLDKLTYAGNLGNLISIASDRRYEFVSGDVCNSALVSDLLGKSVDAVIHFAAESHVDRSIVDAKEFIRTNIEGTFTLLEAARHQRIQRFIHVSTDEVYGSIQPGDFADELSPLQPNSPYAASKAASDLLVRSSFKTYGFPSIITRASNNYGPNQFPEKLIPLIIANAMEDKKLPVYGDGRNERDWIHVDDHCRAIDRVLRKGRPGEIYNIGCGKPVTNLEIVSHLLKILGKPEELIEFVADRPGHDRRYALHIGKIMDELDWHPTIELEDGLRRTIQWYQENSEWVARTRSGEYLAYYKKFYDERRSTLANL